MGELVDKYRKKSPVNREKLVQAEQLFWTTLDNSSSTIANKVGLKTYEVDDYLEWVLDRKFSKIRRRKAANIDWGDL